MTNIVFSLAKEVYLCQSSWNFGSRPNGLLGGLEFRCGYNQEVATKVSRCSDISAPESMITLVSTLFKDLKKYVKCVFDMRVENDVLSAIASELGPITYYKDSSQPFVKVLSAHAKILRDEVLESCYCGGHEFLNENESESVNQHLEKSLPNWESIPSVERPFMLMLSGSDKLLIPELRTHTSLAIGTTFNDTSKVMADGSRLCRQTHDPEGRPYHLGVYLTQKGLDRLLDRTEDEVDAIFPKASMYDTNTVHQDLSNALSNFELREIYVAGICSRIYSFMFHDKSIASFVNDDPDICCMIYEPMFFSQSYLSGLEEKGFSFLKTDLPIVMRIELRALRRNKSRLLQCPNCKAYELFASYGRHYVHYS